MFTYIALISVVVSSSSVTVLRVDKETCDKKFYYPSLDPSKVFPHEYVEVGRLLQIKCNDCTYIDNQLTVQQGRIYELNVTFIAGEDALATLIIREPPLTPGQDIQPIKCSNGYMITRDRNCEAVKGNPYTVSTTMMLKNKTEAIQRVRWGVLSFDHNMELRNLQTCFSTVVSVVDGKDATV